MDFLASAGALRLLAVRLSLTVTGPPSRRPRKYGFASAMMADANRLV
jgi:hypothetical protein